MGNILEGIFEINDWALFVGRAYLKIRVHEFFTHLVESQYFLSTNDFAAIKLQTFIQDADCDIKWRDPKVFHENFPNGFCQCKKTSKVFLCNVLIMLEAAAKSISRRHSRARGSCTI